MTVQKKTIFLNRALFIRRPLQATVLTALTTLIHRFQAEGTYELFIRRDGALIHRAPVRVVEGGVFQINIDVAGVLDDAYTIAPTGALGFFVGKGEAGYSVAIDRITARERETILDSTKGVPAGDLLAVTLVRAGGYRVTDPANKVEGTITVITPEVVTREQRKAGYLPKEAYRPDQPTSVTIGRGEMKPKEVRIFAGQTVIFDCTVPSTLRVEPLDEGPKAQSADAAPRGTLRRTFPKG